MTVIDYLVQAHVVIERGTFYNYLHELGYKDDFYTREEMINSLYPFCICIKKKKVTIIESATNCFLMQRAGKMKGVEEFKDIINSKE